MAKRATPGPGAKSVVESPDQVSFGTRMSAQTVSFSDGTESDDPIIPVKEAHETRWTSRRNAASINDVLESALDRLGLVARDAMIGRYARYATYLYSELRALGVRDDSADILDTNEARLLPLEAIRDFYITPTYHCYLGLARAQKAENFKAFCLHLQELRKLAQAGEGMKDAFGESSVELFITSDDTDMDDKPFATLDTGRKTYDGPARSYFPRHVPFAGVLYGIDAEGDLTSGIDGVTRAFTYSGDEAACQRWLESVWAHFTLTPGVMPGSRNRHKVEQGYHVSISYSSRVEPRATAPGIGSVFAFTLDTNTLLDNPSVAFYDEKEGKLWLIGNEYPDIQMSNGGSLYSDIDSLREVADTNFGTNVKPADAEWRKRKRVNLVYIDAGEPLTIEWKFTDEDLMPQRWSLEGTFTLRSLKDKKKKVTASNAKDYMLRRDSGRSEDDDSDDDNSVPMLDIEFHPHKIRAVLPLDLFESDPEHAFNLVWHTLCHLLSMAVNPAVTGVQETFVARLLFECPVFFDTIQMDLNAFAGLGLRLVRNGYFKAFIRKDSHARLRPTAATTTKELRRFWGDVD